MGRKKKVVVAGHICLDITPVFADKKYNELNQILVPGKLIEVQYPNVHTGGAVANTGLAMKILGVDVSLMGKIGKDNFGQLILDILKKYDSDKEMIVSDTANTSYSIVLAIPGIDRIFLHNSGANNTFVYDDLDFSCIKESSVFHFGYPTLMEKMYQNEGEELLKILKRVKSYNVATSLDMAAIDPASKAGKINWHKILSKILPYVDFFMPSVEELCFMLDKNKYEKWSKLANGKEIIDVVKYEDVRLLGQSVVNMGAKVAIIKCGAPGIYYKTSDNKCIKNLCCQLNLQIDEWADKEGFEKSYKPKIVISGTGAGDTSIAAFLTSVLKEYSLKKSLQMATATGASCVATHDALSGLKSFNELENKIKTGWEKRKTNFCS